MKPLMLHIGRSPAHDVGVAECEYDAGVFIGNAAESLRISWDEAIKLRDWLQLATAERTARLQSSANKSGVGSDHG